MKISLKRHREFHCTPPPLFKNVLSIISFQLKSKLIIHSGSAGEGLIEVIKEHKPDMVLMGSRGLNLLRRTFLGSVSSYVIHHSSTPVTVVPPPEA